MTYSWNFYKDGVTQSLIQCFLQDRYQCKLQYYEGLTPKGEPLHFKYGKIVHSILQQAYIQPKPPTLNELADYLVNYEELILDTTNESLEQTQEQDILGSIAQTILNIYFLHYKDDFKNYTIKTEKSFKVPFFNTHLRGQIDWIYETPSNSIWIVDHKCLSVMTDETTMLAALPFDIQCNLYAYAAQLFLDRPIKGIIYNIIRRPRDAGKVKIEKLDEYKQKLTSTILKDPTHYFKRYKFQFLPEELDHWAKTELKWIVQDIQEWYEGSCKRSYKSGMPSMLTKYGKCQMFDKIAFNNSISYYTRKTPFIELV